MADEPLWNARELKKATKGRWINQPKSSWAPIRVSYDINSLAKPNQLIVCRSSHSWNRRAPDTSRAIPELIKGRQAGAIVQQEQLKNVPKRLPSWFGVLLVKNTRKALQDLGLAARTRFRGKVIALTGTVGKTTSREMLRHTLDRQGGASATRGNNNNLAGVSRSMAYTPRGHGFSIIEVGFGFPLGGVARSSQLVRPHVSLLTAVGLAHLDVFGAQANDEDTGLELVLAQKLGIIDGLEKGGTFVLNRSMRKFDIAARVAKERGVRFFTFGEHPEADLRLVEYEPTQDADGGRVTVELEGQRVEYTIKLPGRHMAINSVGALAVVRAAGGDLQRAAADLADFTAVGGRASISEIQLEGGTATLIDDSYNATPDSIRSTLSLMAQVAREKGAGGRRIAVLGDIRHLGPREAEHHAALAPALAEHGVDHVITFGELMHHLQDAAPKELQGGHKGSHQAVLDAIRAVLKPGDVVTIKASTPVKLGRVAHALRQGKQRLG